jgi:hypothetical protein
LAVVALLACPAVFLKLALRVGKLLCLKAALRAEGLFAHVALLACPAVFFKHSA